MAKSNEDYLHLLKTDNDSSQKEERVARGIRSEYFSFVYQEEELWRDIQEFARRAMDQRLHQAIWNTDDTHTGGPMQDEGEELDW